MPKYTKTLCIKKGCASVLTQPHIMNALPTPPDKESTPPVTSILPYKSFPRKSDSEKKKVSAL